MAVGSRSGKLLYGELPLCVFLRQFVSSFAVCCLTRMCAGVTPFVPASNACCLVHDACGLRCTGPRCSSVQAVVWMAGHMETVASPTPSKRVPPKGSFLSFIVFLSLCARSCRLRT